MDDKMLKTISTSALAYLGDAVIEGCVREYLVESGLSSSAKLNAAALDFVKASKQAQAMLNITSELDEQELAVFKRGRNLGHGNTPKSATVAEYRSATGMEALFGYLWLCEKKERINELFALAYADTIKKHFGIPHISTGEIFREAIASDSELGRLAKKFIDKGNLVPDEVTNEIVKKRLKEEDCSEGFLFDGYPRTIAQAEAFDKMLEELNIKLDVVVNIDVKDDVIISRIINRRLCPSCGRGYNLVSLKPKIEGVCDDCGTPLYQRKDDNEETIKSRLEVYNRQTKPLIEYYENQNLLLQIDGDGKISEIADKIIAGMEAN